ncbi:uncharacterized protein LOC131447499 [Solea solea]|uniref:uncharacterized protein LOC131447499 n=1 Tax=Solea solea TaxID=90069 RepID=UPI00272B1C76|nr:uncharacterized protein LOC131447499 [Solea solea]
MGKSRDLSEFERGLIVGLRSAGCSISQTAKTLGFSRTAVSRVYRDWCMKRKTSSHRGSCGRKRLVDETGEKRMEKVVESNLQATSEQIQNLYNNSGSEKPISLTTTRRTLKRLGYCRKTQQRDSLIAAGLEALASYATGSKGAVCADQNEPETKTESSADAVCKDNNEPSQKTHSSTEEVVCGDDKDPDPVTQASTEVVCQDEKNPD